MNLYTHHPSRFATQIYDDFISKQVDQVFGGVNCMFLAYGASRTGKSHTLYGDEAEPDGIIGKGR